MQKQFPYIGNLLNYTMYTKPNINLRNNLSLKYKEDKKNYCNCLKYLFYKFIPTCYLEAVNKYYLEVDKLPYPNKPKFIAGSRAFDVNDIFKYYCFKKSLNGSKIIGIQHGSNFGTHRYFGDSIEEKFSDFFFTFGWKNSKNNIPIFNFKVPNKTTKLKTFKTKILIVMMPEKINKRFYDEETEFKKYLEDVERLINGIDKSLRKNIILRFHKSSLSFFKNNSNYYNFDLKKFFNKYKNQITFDDGTSNFKKLLLDAKIVIFTYESTGMLECLNLNIPAIMYLHNGVRNLKTKVIKDYISLININIFYTDSELISKKINLIYNDINSWWCDKIKNKNLILFNQKYSNYSKNPLSLLNSILNKIQ